MDIAPKRIIIADDHAVVRTGLQLILDETSDMSIVDEARNGQELIDKLHLNSYDLIVLDIAMPGKDALDVLKEIKATWPLLPVVIFTMNCDEVYAVRMLTNGASAFINKETKPAQIIEVLRIVLSGKKHISQQQAQILTENIDSPKRLFEATHQALTDREFQIFCLLASSMSKSDIAQKLEISINTLSNHRNNILKKMRLSANSDLTRYAIQAGIIK